MWQGWPQEGNWRSPPYRRTVGSHPLRPNCWRSPLVGASRATTPCGRIAGSRPLRPDREWQPLVGWPQPVVPAGGCYPYGWLPLADCCPCGRPPITGGLAVAGRPLQVAWPQPVAPLRGGLGCSRSPPCRWTGHALLPLLLIAFTVKTQQECVERFYAIQSHHK
ncbi:hypothetical protein GW17_00058371 [Ensete ventricosum]|nr:hypothetical protein GW17_00058371 [Ensete ventricosum]RZS28299.1 hypothetical protein BHM03_00061871 [Ensete ventricosum]